MKLELRHLAGYLPYGLKLLSHENEIQTLTGVRDETYFIEKGNVYAYGDIQDSKPILFPLSDLTKEIEVNGEKFVPIKKLTKMFDLHDSYQLKFENNLFVLWDKKNEWYKINDNNFSLFQKLYEWHFDIYGLIENGLAIDINTL